MLLTLSGLLLLCLFAASVIKPVPKGKPKAKPVVDAPVVVAATDPFEPKVAPLPAVLSPAPGQAWVPRQAEGDPFEPQHERAVTIFAVKQGWVLYGYDVNHGEKARQPISKFILEYQPLAQ